MDVIVGVDRHGTALVFVQIRRPSGDHVDEFT
jgi:hypothetical protein